MAKQISREFVLSKGAVPIAGVRTKGMSIGNETIDFTDDDSDGWQELSSAVGRREVTVTVGGLYVNNDILDFALAENIQDTFTLTNSEGRSISGTFNITSYSETGGGSDGELEFEAELSSSGVITKSVSGG